MIAAGAVVSRNVPPYTIVVGVPARPIRKRFPDYVAESLRRIAWWDWPDEIIFERLSDFRSEAIDQFCERYDPAFAPLEGKITKKNARSRPGIFFIWRMPLNTAAAGRSADSHPCPTAG